MGSINNVVKRGNNVQSSSLTLYEVPAQQWADITTGAIKRGQA